MAQVQEPEVQESKTEKTALAVTKTEKAALRFVSAHRQTTESELLRTVLIGDIVVEYDRLMDALRSLDSVPAVES